MLISRPWRLACLSAAFVGTWGAVTLAQERSTPALSSPQRNPAQEARDRATVEAKVANPLDEFILTVPGRAYPSYANIVENDLVIRDAVGREWVYVRSPEYDSADGKFVAYFCPTIDTYLLWPANGVGPLQVGRVGPDKRILFRPSTMSVRGSAVKAVPAKVIDPVIKEGPVPVADLPPAEAVESVNAGVRLPGAYYVDGPTGGVATITRNRDTKAYEYTGPDRKTYGVDWMPRGSSITLNQGENKLKGTASHDVLSFDKSKMYRLAVLGCYFDANDRPQEIVMDGGKIVIRGLNTDGEVQKEPLTVTSAVDVVSPSRGKAHLRNGRLVWADSKEEWTGPIFLQGYWKNDDRECEIEQDGQQLTFITDNGKTSVGKVMTAKTIVASDWAAPATFNVAQNVIEFENGDKWIRTTEDPFPVADAPKPAARAATNRPERPLPTSNARVTGAPGLPSTETPEADPNEPLPEKVVPGPGRPKSKLPPAPVLPR